MLVAEMDQNPGVLILGLVGFLLHPRPPSWGLCLLREDFTSVFECSVGAGSPPGRRQLGALELSAPLQAWSSPHQTFPAGTKAPCSPGPSSSLLSWCSWPLPVSSLWRLGLGQGWGGWEGGGRFLPEDPWEVAW